MHRRYYWAGKKNMTGLAPLWGCCDSSDDACCCVASAVCPGIAYGENYALAVRDPHGCACCCPCVMHSILDALVPAALTGALPGRQYLANIPLGCCLRTWQRSVVVNTYLLLSADQPQQQPPQEREPLWESFLLETFCWPCSLVQIHKTLKNNGAVAFTGNSLLGTLVLQPPPAADNTMMLLPQ